MRRRYLATTAVVGLLAGGTTLAAGQATGRSSSSAPGKHPPRPTLRTLGASRSASLVSYCWTYPSGDGGSAGECADGSLADLPPTTLRWRPRATVHLNLHLPAHDIEVDTYRQGSGGPSQVPIHLHRVDSSGRRWVFHVPRATKDHTDLLISATFARGDVFAAIGLHKK
jgi:hypothetical protein